MEQENKTQAELLSDEALAQQMKQSGAGKGLLKFLLYVLGAAMIVCFFARQYLLMAVAVLLALACAYFSSKKENRQKALLGDQVVKTTLAELFQLETYAPFGYIQPDAVKRAELVGDWEESTGSDYFSGVYHGVRVHFADLELTDVEKTIDADGNEDTNRHTVFKGQWLVIETKRSVDAQVRVLEKSGLLGKLAKSSVQTENDAFNRKFQILTSDPHTAFLILTPHFMEFINAADAAANGQTLLSFVGTEVHYAINSGRNLFEVGRGASDVPALRQRIRQEATYITDIVDELLKNGYLFEGEK